MAILKGCWKLKGFWLVRNISRKISDIFEKKFNKKFPKVYIIKISKKSIAK